ncbi:hypothetical protein HOY80DRAFT_973714 [Tuber brumale]|nr:hypothetical protein HOY80DRAFT_973714 [Tuber brumale]
MVGNPARTLKLPLLVRSVVFLPFYLSQLRAERYQENLKESSRVVFFALIQRGKFWASRCRSQLFLCQHGRMEGKCPYPSKEVKVWDVTGHGFRSHTEHRRWSVLFLFLICSVARAVWYRRIEYPTLIRRS